MGYIMDNFKIALFLQMPGAFYIDSYNLKHPGLRFLKTYFIYITLSAFALLPGKKYCPKPFKPRRYGRAFRNINVNGQAGNIQMPFGCRIHGQNLVFAGIFNDAVGKKSNCSFSLFAFAPHIYKRAHKPKSAENQQRQKRKICSSENKSNNQRLIALL